MTLLLICSNAKALETPYSGHFDRRVKHINYNPQQVVKLVGHYGFSTDIEFAVGESVQQIAMGDVDAWSVTPVANHIFIKPKALQAVTNMTVLTKTSSGNHAYNFELSAHWSQRGAHPIPNDMMFQVRFIYPQQVAARDKAKQKQQQLKARLNSVQTPKVRNQNYFYKGNTKLLPVSVFDDGRFTYITFNGKQDFPAVYIVGSDDQESLVNSNVNAAFPYTIIIQRIAKQLVLRQGNKVLCLFNQSYQFEHAANYTTSNIPNVERQLKGGQ
ncbi:P-type conjugative transfer protein VirB9 [Parashewanella spongiae]|uniref:P-type conjugative transfer protein VirB9 n=2 Tax=Parashewanella spongiae TaxID=342950 RepID=A0A3A6U348_9GAMM|nr:P-type conjugative transfer protein VirB9 [Parashewanella spongiae]